MPVMEQDDIGPFDVVELKIVEDDSILLQLRNGRTLEILMDGVALTDAGVLLTWEAIVATLDDSASRLANRITD